MTTEQRFDRLEHYVVGLAEERRKDREEYRQFWRETQRQINDLTLKIADTNDTVTRVAEEVQESDRKLGERITQLAEESRTADQKLGERIESLVSAIGKFLNRDEQ